jgi:hypothetical protein
MRRILSITVILALCWTMVSPAWAAVCSHGNGAQMMCHRTAHSHDCGMMEHHHDADSDSGPAISMAQQDEKCPMNCCMQAGHSTAKPVSLAADVLPLLSSQAFPLFESQVFTAAGFSSHTDRGPPLA